MKSPVIASFAFFLVSLSTSVAIAANPTSPITPSMNIQDPGASTTPWGGCGPTDPNCYVDLNAGAANFSSLTVTGPTTINTSGVAATTIGNAASTTTIAGPTNLTGAVTFTSLPSLPLAAGNLFIGSVGNLASAVALSGDASVTSAGVLTIANDAVTLPKLAANSVNAAKIVDGTIGNDDISAAAAIAYSKLALGNSLILSDLASNSVDGAKIVDGSVLSADISDDVLDFTKLEDLLDLDASTDIATGTHTLSITNDGVGTTLRVNDNGSGDLSPFIIDPSGNVGIGTTTPGAALEVTSTSPNEQLRLRAAAGGGNGLSLFDGGGNAAARGWGFVTNAIAWGDFHIREATGQGANPLTGNSRLTILSGGNVGIGTTTPSYPLHVVMPADGSVGTAFRAPVAGVKRPGLFLSANEATGEAAIDFSGGIGYFGQLKVGGSNVLTLANNGNVGIGTTDPQALFHAAGSVRFSTCPSATLTTDALGNITCTSDERLKETTGLFDRGVDALLQIQPIVFHWNAISGFDPTVPVAGFSAQNVQAAVPEAVGTSGPYLTFSDRPILATAVNAIRQIWRRADSSDARVRDLERRLHVLEERLAGLAVDTDAANTVAAVDLEPPIISVTGDTRQTIEMGTPWSDLGAVASDNVGIVGDISVSVDGRSSTSAGQATIDTSRAGEYVVVYEARDAAGNVATARRDVSVIPVTAPTL